MLADHKQISKRTTKRNRKESLICIFFALCLLIIIFFTVFKVFCPTSRIKWTELPAKYPLSLMKTVEDTLL